MKGCRILSNASSASNEMIIRFVFKFGHIVHYIDGFPYIEPSLNPCDEAYLIMLDDLFDVLVLCLL